MDLFAVLVRNDRTLCRTRVCSENQSILDVLQRVDCFRDA
jgi:hypothetical protein